MNSYNLGLLGLGFGNRAAISTREFGFYLTGKYRFLPDWAIFGGTGPGTEANLTTRLGIEHALEKSLSFFVEIGGLFTKDHLTAADAAALGENRTAFITETGFYLSW